MITGTELLEALPVAVYTTDAAGRITFYNRAAAELWGHHPELGSSQWCGSWRLYRPDGRPLPHRECPMAIALRGRRERDDRPVDPADHSARIAWRGEGDPRAAATRRTHRALRDRARRQGWPPRRRIADRLSAARPIGKGGRRIEGRPRHHRPQAGRENAARSDRRACASRQEHARDGAGDRKPVAGSCQEPDRFCLELCRPYSPGLAFAAATRSATVLKPVDGAATSTLG